MTPEERRHFNGEPPRWLELAEENMRWRRVLLSVVLVAVALLAVLRQWGWL
jgi:hypothetical protein